MALGLFVAAERVPEHADENARGVLLGPSRWTPAGQQLQTAPAPWQQSAPRVRGHVRRRAAAAAAPISPPNSEHHRDTPDAAQSLLSGRISILFLSPKRH